MGILPVSGIKSIEAITQSKVVSGYCSLRRHRGYLTAFLVQETYSVFIKISFRCSLAGVCEGPPNMMEPMIKCINVGCLETCQSSFSNLHLQSGHVDFQRGASELLMFRQGAQGVNEDMLQVEWYSDEVTGRCWYLRKWRLRCLHALQVEIHVRSSVMLQCFDRFQQMCFFHFDVKLKFIWFLMFYFIFDFFNFGDIFWPPTRWGWLWPPMSC